MKPQLNTRSRTVRIFITSLFILAVLAAALPKPVQAASCQAYYTVKSGDTTPFIAHTFGFKWKDIASANDMKPYEKLKVGQVLCIPTEGSTSTKSGVKTDYPENESNAKISMYISSGKIYFSLSKYKSNHTYLAKIRDVGTGVGGWYRLGKFDVQKNKATTVGYTIPKDMRDTTFISACLKDQSTDELICRTVGNP